MQAQHAAIGETAGKVYQALSKGGDKTKDALAKELQLKDKELFYEALGWLAREGKINFDKKGNSEKISLSGVEAGSCCQA